MKIYYAPIHIIWVELQLSLLPDESVHIAGFGREDLDVLEFNEEIMEDSTFRNRRLVKVSQPYVPLMIFSSDLN
jgi:hypothetical protein